MVSANAKPHLTKYIVESSDVISDMRVNVLEERSRTVVWYKERHLTDTEIVSSLYSNHPSPQLLWTVHRPKRGWYLRVRAPFFPPDAFIPLVPVPKSSPHHADAALALACRVAAPNTHRSSVASVAGSSRSSVEAAHSYPPTPPVIIAVSPPSPTAVSAKLAPLAEDPSTPTRNGKSPSTSGSTTPTGSPPDALQIPRGSRRPKPSSSSSTTSASSSSSAQGSRRSPASSVRRISLPPRALTGPTTLGHFVLTPAAAADVGAESIWARAWSVLASRAPVQNLSFTLCQVPPPAPAFSSSNASSSTAALNGAPGSPPTASTAATALMSSPPIPHASSPPTTSVASLPALATQTPTIPLPPPPPSAPLVEFTDLTPALTLYATRGLLALDEGALRALGVDRGFWVAVALCYVEYLGEREGYMAASTD